MDSSSCSFPQCEHDTKAHGLCSGHYAQQRKGRPLYPLGGWRDERCLGPDCDRNGTSRHPMCRRCRAKHRYATDPEYRRQVLDAQKERYRSDPEVRAKAIASAARWREENPEAHAEHRKRMQENARERERTDPAYRAHRRAQMKARRERAGNAYRSLRNVLYLLEQQGGRCAICGDWLPEERSEVHVDHKVPTIAGGTDEIDNLQLTHARCNQRKGIAA